LYIFPKIQLNDYEINKRCSIHHISTFVLKLNSQEDILTARIVEEEELGRVGSTNGRTMLKLEN
jgi:hypothetical protein